MRILLGEALPLRSDLIFVHAGKEDRKRYALQLFASGIAPLILFSVSRFEIRRFSTLPLPVPLDLLKLASDVPPPQRHFFVLLGYQTVHAIYVRPRFFGTLTEIESLRHWLLNHPEIHSIVIVSSSSHLKRIAMCCKFLLSGNLDIVLTATPTPPAQPPHSPRLSAALFERLKTLTYWLILILGHGRARSNPATLPEKP